MSNQEQLVICIRRVDNNTFTIHEDAVELIQLPKTNSETIVKAIIDCLIQFSLSQCHGQAYDGTSNMSG